MKVVSKFIGCTMIMVGSIIGAGMLAIPMLLAKTGFVLSVIITIGVWGISIITGLLILEVNLALPVEACSFSSMAKITLGTGGKITAWLSYLLYLYSLLSLYMCGESPIIRDIVTPLLNIKIPLWIITIIFSSILGAFVLYSTKAVDYINRVLLSFKGFLLITSLVLILFHVNSKFLFIKQSVEQLKHIIIALPVLFISFNAPYVIPSIRIYLGDKPKQLKWIIISSATISLIVYLLWIIGTLGTVPLTGANSFATLTQLGRSADPNDFMKILTKITNNQWVTASIKWFFNISMTTAFLGVSLGLFDFFIDGFKISNTKLGRFKTAGLTFIPPLLFAIFYPHGFLMALNYSASFVSVLCLILPVLMVYKLRHNQNLVSIYRSKIGNFIFISMLIIGVALFLSPILI